MSAGRLVFVTNLALLLLYSQALAEPEEGKGPAPRRQPGAHASRTAPAPAASARSDQAGERQADWEVQAAAMRRPAGADLVVRRLADKGYRALVLRADESADAWCRVRVGGLQTRPETQALAGELRAKGFEGAFVPTR